MSAVERLPLEAPLPTIVVEIKRYDEPTEGWAFTTFAPSAQGWASPFDGYEADYSELRLFTEETAGWGEQAWTEKWRAEHLEGFTVVPWDEVPERFRGYVFNCIAPVEWQTDESFVAGRTTVHIRGEWPN